MPEALLNCVEVDPDEPVRASVIWLHGLGANGHDFEPILSMLGVQGLGIRFVFPHAPQIPVTINGGFVMPAWYDILGMGPSSPQDDAGIVLSSQRITRLIEREQERGVLAERIVLAGFSQGGAIALHLGVRFPERLAGIVALSTYMVRAGSLDTERNLANKDVPILQCHGTYDPMVLHARGVEARELLRASGYAVEWHEYPMQHQVCDPEIDVIGAFLRKVLAAGRSNI